MEIPSEFHQESFSGFGISDSEVGSGEMRAIAIEMKHLFESLVIDADEKNEEFFLAEDLERTLRAFLFEPSSFRLTQLLVVSPTLHDPVVEIAKLVSPSMLNNIPTVV